VRLPIAPGVESLNVSAAAAVALYEIARGVPAEDDADDADDEADEAAGDEETDA
jgi:tRNA C32,U32 (ribose-2'-O)-methylase TrmJ